MSELDNDLFLARLGDYPGSAGSKRLAAEIERLQAVADRAFDALEYIRRQDGKGPDGLIDWQRCVNRIQEVASTALASMQEKGE